MRIHQLFVELLFVMLILVYFYALTAHYGKWDPPKTFEGGQGRRAL